MIQEAAPYPPSRPQPLYTIVRDGLDYPKLELKYEYPPDFSPDSQGPRIAKLNSALLILYNKLVNTYNELSWTKAVQNHNKAGLDPFQKDQLQEDVDRAQNTFDTIIEECRDYLSEVDAVGGVHAFYLPDELKKNDMIGLPENWRRSESGSMSELKEAQHYIPEEVIQPANAFEGLMGSANRSRNKRFEEIAFACNRIKYLKACGCKGLQLEVPLKRLVRLVTHVISSASYDTLLMPEHLREAAGFLLSDALSEGMLVEDIYGEGNDEDLKDDEEESEENVAYVESSADVQRRRIQFVREMESEISNAQKSRKLEERLLELERLEKADAKRQKQKEAAKAKRQKRS